MRRKRNLGDKRDEGLGSATGEHHHLEIHGGYCSTTRTEGEKKGF